MTSTPHNPDERDLLDFADAVNAGQNPQPTNDMERTYLHVQNAMQGESSSIPSTTKQSTWEDVMSTLAITPEAPVSNRTRKRQALSSPSFTPKRMRWSPLASVAAAALVILASFGVWFTSGNESAPPPVEPRQVAGLTPGELLQVATPTVGYACDFSQDMPIVSSNEQLPIDGTYLVWQSGGDLILRCDEEVEDIVLASNINQAGPVEGIPGMVMVYLLEEGATDLGDGYSVYINVTNGESFVTGNVNVDRGFWQQAWGDYQNGPVLFIHNQDGILVALDTRTMNAMPIGEMFGADAPQSFNLLQDTSEDGSTLALMLGDQEAANTATHPMPALRASETGADGDLLLLNLETGVTLWLSLPISDTEYLSGAIISPDASMVAVTIALRSEDIFAMESRIMIVDTQDGSILHETDWIETFGMETLWTEQGLVVQGYRDLLLLPTDDGETQLLYQLDSETSLQGLKPTMDPNVIVVDSILCEGECKLAESNVGVVAINLETVETNRYIGQNAASLSWSDSNNLLLLTDPGVASPDTTTYTVVDPVSGDTVATFEDVPGIGMIERQYPLIGPKSIDVSADGQTRVVAIGVQNIFALTSDGTEHSARLLPVPGRWADVVEENPTAILFLSPDGTQLSVMANGDEAQTRFILDLTDPDAEWIPVEYSAPGGGGYILFVEGVREN